MFLYGCKTMLSKYVVEKNITSWSQKKQTGFHVHNSGIQKSKKIKTIKKTQQDRSLCNEGNFKTEKAANA